MTAFVTLDEAKAHLRIDYASDDTEVQDKLDEAQGIVLDYLKNPTGVFYEPDGVTPLTNPPAPVTAAIKLVLGNLWRYREGGDERYTVHVDPISQAVISLLMRLRDPAFA
jgi:hypothetical protein